MVSSNPFTWFFLQMHVLTRTQLNTQWEPSRVLQGSHSVQLFPFCFQVLQLQPTWSPQLLVLSQLRDDSRLYLGSLPFGLKPLWKASSEGSPQWNPPSQRQMTVLHHLVSNVLKTTLGSRYQGGRRESSWEGSGLVQAPWTWEWGVWVEGQTPLSHFPWEWPTPPQLRWICSMENLDLKRLLQRALHRISS